MAVTLILGGARSGKSRFAEQLAINHNAPVHYLATAQALDQEMVERIAHHQANRPDDWALLEEPVELVALLQQPECQQAKVILVDCLTLWLSNLLCRGDTDEQLKTQIDLLAQTIATHPGKLLLVSNEVGQGVVADNLLARRFVDQSGWMNQIMAQVATEVVLVTAGLPLWLKREHT